VFGGNDDYAPRSPLYERYSVELEGTAEAPAPEGEPGHGLRVLTTRGEVACIYHEATPGSANVDPHASLDAPHPPPTASGATHHAPAVLWLPGSRGGFAGPADGLYRDLAVALAGEGIASLRLNYRQPGNLDESTLDALCGAWALAALGHERIAAVGHSFGGGVAISTARYTTHIRGVAALSSQTDGAQEAVLLTPRALLVVHGEADGTIPVSKAHTIYSWAFEPKRIVTYPGASHGLRECAAQVRALLAEWLPDTLAG
jgi:alpha/beta superfamily hydrolase